MPLKKLAVIMLDPDPPRPTSIPPEFDREKWKLGGAWTGSIIGDNKAPSVTRTRSKRTGKTFARILSISLQAYTVFWTALTRFKVKAITPMSRTDSRPKYGASNASLSIGRFVPPTGDERTVNGSHGLCEPR